jgi:hypothetical protein
MNSALGRQRLVELGDIAELDDGEPLVLRGPVYELRKEPGVQVQLAFLRDDQKRILVGYARREDGEWIAADYEVYSLRALGYWERRLKRIGERVEQKDRTARW